MRVFLALELPEEFKDEIEKVQNGLQRVCSEGIKWVKREHWHITLQFIGDTNPEIIPKLKREFTVILKGLRQFYIYHPQIEAIPARRPRLIWIKCDYNSPELGSVVKVIRDLLHREGYQIDQKPFRLHITLGRVRKYIPPEIVNQLTEPTLSDQRRKISKATFYESRLHSDGPEYSSIEQYCLQYQDTEE